LRTVDNELPNLRERFGDVSLSGAERLLRIDAAKHEIRRGLQDAIDEIAVRLNPKPRKNIDIGELLRRAVDKGDAEARALANVLNTWTGQVAVQFAVDLEAPAFVAPKDAEPVETASSPDVTEADFLKLCEAVSLFGLSLERYPNSVREVRSFIDDLNDEAGLGETELFAAVDRIARSNNPDHYFRAAVGETESVTD
jgi:hypothetical protein